MEAKMQEVIDAINNLGRFSVQDTISILALIASWITIWVLLKEKMDANRPYVQVSFELIRANLACVVIRNTGNVPVSICDISFNKDFISQLPEDDERRLLENGISDMRIFPNKQWAICLGVIVPTILKYKNTNMEVEYSYKRIGRKKIYKESTNIDFNQYSKCLVYISEIDELREVNKKIAEDIKTLKRGVESIKTVVTKYNNLDDAMEKNVVCGCQIIRKLESEAKE